MKKIRAIARITTESVIVPITFFGTWILIMLAIIYLGSLFESYVFQLESMFILVGLFATLLGFISAIITCYYVATKVWMWLK